uniref:Hsp70 family protein n=1 Tax=Saccharothrix mutabilis TaxID=33921 RepID=UPI003CD09A99
MLLDLQPGPRGQISIEVTVECDVNGVIHLRARQVGARRSATTTVTVSRATIADAAQRPVRPYSAIVLEGDRPRRRGVRRRPPASSARRPTRVIASAGSDAAPKRPAVT